jgi:3-oxoacyl-[acyl-carrier protein] reductase
MEKNLLDRIAVVTGAAQGIGRGIASILCEAGAKVLIVDLNEEKGEEVAEFLSKGNSQATFYKADLRKETEIKACMDFAGEKWGGIDILVNSVRPFIKSDVPYEDSFEEWDYVIDALLKAPAMTAKHAFPHLAKSTYPSIVNISSGCAFNVMPNVQVSYHVATAGVVQLTRFLAVQFSHEGIRVNCIAPNLVVAPDKPMPRGMDDDLVRRVVPLGRPASVEEIAKAVQYLCSEESSYITGHILNVDGGLGMLDNYKLALRLEGKIQ